MQQHTVILVPGLGDSGPNHWQTRWQQQYPQFRRIRQKDWDTPSRQDWVETLEREVRQHKPQEVVLVAHSLACIAVAFWGQQFGKRIKGALLVAPADTEASSFPEGCTGFTPVPLAPLPFPSIVVGSNNDPYISPERARELARSWGSRYVNIGQAGHINTSAGYGRWDEGLALLQSLCGAAKL